MQLSKEAKAGIGVIAILCGVMAIPMTEWTEGHPIGSFAESFAAVALVLASFAVSALVGLTAKRRLDSSQRLYRASTFVGWFVGIVCVLICCAVLTFIPGISEALDRLQASSRDA